MNHEKSSATSTAPAAALNSRPRPGVESAPAAAGWRRALSWLALIVAVVAQAGVALVVSVSVVLGTEGVCDEPALAADLAKARIDLAGVLAVSIAVWLPAVILGIRRQRWVRFAVAALLGTVIPTLFLITALRADAADWTMSWCF